MRDITALGGHFVLTFVTLAVIGYLLLAGKRGAALLVFVSVAGGALLGDLLKLGFQRPRPDLVPHGVRGLHGELPEQPRHALGRHLPDARHAARTARGAAPPQDLFPDDLGHADACWSASAASISACTGRPTCIAGWSVGAAWAMGVWLVALILQRRGKVEQPEG